MVQYSVVQYGTVQYSTVRYSTVHLRVPVYNLDSVFNFHAGGIKSGKVLGLKRCQGCQDLKVLRVTRNPGSKGLLRDRVFSRTHLWSSLTPEEGPSSLF